LEKGAEQVSATIRINCLDHNYFDLSPADAVDFGRFCESFRAHGYFQGPAFHVPYVAVASVVLFPNGIPQQQTVGETFGRPN